MTRFSSDQLAKQYLQDFLEPLGTVQRNLEVPGEPKFVDIWFSPNPTAAQEHDLGLLSRIAKTPCLLEPFRNAPKLHEVEMCLLKLLWIREDQRRKAKRTKQKLLAREKARLWILATRVDQPVIKAFSGQLQPSWAEGVFFLPEALNTALVAINKLPINPDTLWLRLLGKGETLKQAIGELLDMPPDDSRQSQVLQLLVNWRISVELERPRQREEQELMATLSQAYLEWEQRTLAKGEQRGLEQGLEQGLERGLERERALVSRQLAHQFGELPALLRRHIEQLSLEQLENLGVALLDFQSLSDLENWLKD
jgi:hypothetical protein